MAVRVRRRHRGPTPPLDAGDDAAAAPLVAAVLVDVPRPSGSSSRAEDDVPDDVAAQVAALDAARAAQGLRRGRHAPGRRSRPRAGSSRRPRRAPRSVGPDLPVRPRQRTLDGRVRPARRRPRGAAARRASGPSGRRSPSTSSASGSSCPILGRYAERFGASGRRRSACSSPRSRSPSSCARRCSGGCRTGSAASRSSCCRCSAPRVGSLVTGAAGALWVLFVGPDHRRRVGRERVGGPGRGHRPGPARGAAPPARPARARRSASASCSARPSAAWPSLGGPHVPFFVAAAVAFVNGLVAIRRLPETRRPGAAVRGARPGPSAPSAATRIWVLRRRRLHRASCAFSGFEATFSLFADRRFGLTEGPVALIFLGVGLLLVLVQTRMVQPVVARVGRARRAAGRPRAQRGRARAPLDHPDLVRPRAGARAADHRPGAGHPQPRGRRGGPGARRRAGRGPRLPAALAGHGPHRRARPRRRAVRARRRAGAVRRRGPAAPSRRWASWSARATPPSG